MQCVCVSSEKWFRSARPPLAEGELEVYASVFLDFVLSAS
jgi:hypothetical protein